MSSTVAVRSSLKVANGRGEKGTTKKRDKNEGPTEGENAATNLLSRQSSASSDRDPGPGSTKEPPQIPARQASATKGAGGSTTKPSGPAASAASALRSPLSKGNGAPPPPKSSKPRQQDGDGPAKAPLNRSKPAAATPALSEPRPPSKEPKDASVPSSDGKGGATRTSASRQGLQPNGGATRSGAGSVPRSSPSATRGSANGASSTGATKVKEAHKLESHQSSASVTNNPVNPELASSGQVPKADNVDSGLRSNESELVPTDHEPKPAEPTPVPAREQELVAKLGALTEERDRLVQALTDREQEFRVREKGLLDQLRAASASDVEQKAVGGVGGTVGTEEAESGLQEGAVQNREEVTGVDPATDESALCAGNDEKMAAELKVKQMEAAQKEREMDILRGEQEIARLRLDLQASEDQLAQSRKELELCQSELADLKRQLCLAQSGTLLLPGVAKCDPNCVEDKNLQHVDGDHGGNLNQVGTPNVSHEDKPQDTAKPTSTVVQWCKALLSEDQEGEVPSGGTGEEVALLEVIKEYRERMQEKLRAMEESCHHEHEVGVEVVEMKSGSKGKQFRSDVDADSTDQDVTTKRIKPDDDVSSTSPSSRLVRKAKRRSGGSGSGAKLRSMDGSQATEMSEGVTSTTNAFPLDNEPTHGDKSSSPLCDDAPLSPAVEHTPFAVAGTDQAASSVNLAAEGLKMAAKEEVNNECTHDPLSKVVPSNLPAVTSTLLRDTLQGKIDSEAVSVGASVLIPDETTKCEMGVTTYTTAEAHSGSALQREVVSSGMSQPSEVTESLTNDQSQVQNPSGASDGWISVVIPRVA